MPRTTPRTRTPKTDAILADSVALAREAAEAVASPRPVGDHVGFTMEADRLGTHYFVSTDPGYAGWCWACLLYTSPSPRD